MPPLPQGPYDIVYADPPWYCYGSQLKDAAAAKHYPPSCRKTRAQPPVRNIMARKSALFLWETCPRLNFAIELIERWGLIP
ncbi:MAG: hypothetical protein JO349_02210 [Candidatus Eremiobacteraeota bacterium]|nr:hypothetical protein [Candidatus Eremiobacteraeota bacterium]